jgi:hypothetical protein
VSELKKRKDNPATGLKLTILLLLPAPKEVRKRRSKE